MKISYMAIPGVTQLLEHQLKRACDITGVEVADVKCKCRKKELVLARQLYCFLAKRYATSSPVEIGRLINIGHANVVYHIKRVEDFIEMKDSYFMKYYNRL